MELPWDWAPLESFYLSELLKVNNPMVVFPSGDKVGLRKLEFLKERLVMNGIGFSTRGRSSGFALLWDKKITVSIQSYSSNLIDAIVFPDDVIATWRFTGFYGEPEQGNQKLSWDFLRQLGSLSSLLWVYMGDFNEILDVSERRGGIPMMGWGM